MGGGQRSNGWSARSMQWVEGRDPMGRGVGGDLMVEGRDAVGGGERSSASGYRVEGRGEGHYPN